MPSGRANQAPRSAALFASLPPLVKTTSSGAAPSSAATWARARSMTALASRPPGWSADGFAYGPSSSGRMTAATRGSIGVLAL